MLTSLSRRQSWFILSCVCVIFYFCISKFPFFALANNCLKRTKSLHSLQSNPSFAKRQFRNYFFGTPCISHSVACVSNHGDNCGNLMAPSHASKSWFLFHNVSCEGFHFRREKNTFFRLLDLLGMQGLRLH